MLYFLISLNLISFKEKKLDNNFSINTTLATHSDLKVLKIPKINLNLPVVKADKNFNNLNKNLVYYNNFDINNKIIIFGHSRMGNGRFFNKLDELNYDDVVYIEYNNKKYIYKIMNIYEVSKKDVYILNDEYNSKKLLLVTCVKYNKDKRLVIELTVKSVEK